MKKNSRTNGLTFILIVLAILTAFMALIPYFSGKNTPSRVSTGDGNGFHFFVVLVHACLGTLALVSGAFQFSNYLRLKHTVVHRAFGRVYFATAAFSAVIAIIAALISKSGFAVQVGLLLGGLAWLVSTIIAYMSILQRNIIRHQIWVIRSYSLALSAFTLRIWFPIGIGIYSATNTQPVETVLIGDGYQQIYTVAVWLPFFINVLLVEWFILKNKKISSEKDLPL